MQLSLLRGRHPDAPAGEIHFGPIHGIEHVQTKWNDVRALIRNNLPDAGFRVHSTARLASLPVSIGKQARPGTGIARPIGAAAFGTRCGSWG